MFNIFSHKKFQLQIPWAAVAMVVQNVSNAHILTYFQRKSLIKTVEKELLKSCKTKWRQL